MTSFLPRRRTTLLAASTAFAVLAAAAFGGVLSTRDAAPSKPAPASAEARAALDALGIRTSEPTIDQLEQDVRTSPSAGAFAALGLAHLQVVQETGDPSGYARAEAALDRALELDPEAYPALLGAATLAAGRHKFNDSLELARRASVLRPASIEALGILGDSQVELGRYEAAFATFDEMTRRRPSFPAYVRVSYGRELSGDRDGAIDAMSLAIDAAKSGTQPRAFALTHRGNLYLSLDRLDAAAADYDAALEAAPDDPGALTGLAHLALARGDDDAAVDFARRAAEASALPEHAMSLSAVLQATGRMDDVRRTDALVAQAVEQEREVGAELDFELAVFQLDRGTDAAGALRAIERTWADGRRSVGVADAMAWALVRNGRCDEAIRYSELSMRLGGVDGSKGFHRAEAERCLGNQAAARTWYRRALAADPHFSPIHVARARAGAAGRVGLDAR